MRRADATRARALPLRELRLARLLLRLSNPPPPPGRTHTPRATPTTMAALALGSTSTVVTTAVPALGDMSTLAAATAVPRATPATTAVPRATPATTAVPALGDASTLAESMLIP